MKLLSFSYKGRVYALLISQDVVRLYTSRDALDFKSYYEAIDWLRYR